MELKDFVSETLKQIIDGVVNAQNHAIEHGAEINPRDLHLLKSGSQPAYSNGGHNKFAQVVDFDVALTTTDGKKGKGGVGVFTGPLNIGGNLQTEQLNSSISKINFSVPIFLPTQEKNKS